MPAALLGAFPLSIPSIHKASEPTLLVIVSRSVALPPAGESDHPPRSSLLCRSCG